MGLQPVVDKTRTLDSTEIKRQFSFVIPITWWKLIRLEAAKQNCSMSYLISEWLKPHIERLKGTKGSGCIVHKFDGMQCRICGVSARSATLGK